MEKEKTKKYREVLKEIETGEIISDIKFKPVESGGVWFIKHGFHWKYGETMKLATPTTLLKKGLKTEKIELKEEVYAK